jgi:hypothetical protein
LRYDRTTPARARTTTSGNSKQSSSNESDTSWSSDFEAEQACLENCYNNPKNKSKEGNTTSQQSSDGVGQPS